MGKKKKYLHFPGRQAYFAGNGGGILLQVLFQEEKIISSKASRTDARTVYQAVLSMSLPPLKRKGSGKLLFSTVTGTLWIPYFYDYGGSAFLGNDNVLFWKQAASTEYQDVWAGGKKMGFSGFVRTR